MPSPARKLPRFKAAPAARKRRPKHHHFIVAWMRAPLKVGSLMPSSKTLARAMAGQVDISKPGAVIELGAGTGVVTHALVETGMSGKQLLVLEREQKLHAILRAEFPELNIVCGDAARLDHVLSEHNISRVNAIVSSLPLLSMPKKVRLTIEQRMASLIGDGVLVQFTYGPQSPIRRGTLRKYGLAGKRVKTVLANVPPAHVWVYRKAL